MVEQSDQLDTSQPDGLFAWAPDWVIHPGAILDEALTERGMSIIGCAFAADLAVMTITDILAGEFEITEAIARQLNLATGISARMWMNLEASFRQGLAEGKTWVK